MWYFYRSTEMVRIIFEKHEKAPSFGKFKQQEVYTAADGANWYNHFGKLVFPVEHVDTLLTQT